MLLIQLEKRELIKPPTWLPTNTIYLTRMGSTAYGVSDSNSDEDIYGVTIPPRDYIFPPNFIDGFDNKDLTFHQWQQHHIKDPSANGGKGCTYDFAIYNIVNYFKLVMENNPNTLDSLFVRRECVMHITQMWEVVREHRKIFLHKGVTQRMRGYAYNQLSSAKNCTQYVTSIRSFEDDFGIPHTTTYEQVKNKEYQVINREEFDAKNMHVKYLELWETGLAKTKRFQSQKIHNTDVKFLYHVFRLVDQAEYILNHHDLDLQEKSRVEKMKAIRRGDLTYEQVCKDFSDAEARLNNLYETSTLRKFPETKQVRNLLITCLEHHYGSLSNVLKEHNPHEAAVKEIRDIFRKYNL